MIPDNWAEIIIKLTLALLFGGLIGFERGRSNHEAGIKTHILVALGSAGIMIMSSEMASSGYSMDISRIGAQVVSGIGFLGTGCILISGGRIKGLTTAAGLWTTACVGLSTGMGYYFIGGMLTVFSLLAMLLLSPISKYLQKEKRVSYTLTAEIAGRENGSEVLTVLDRRGCKIVKVSGDEKLEIELECEPTAVGTLLGELHENGHVKSAMLKKNAN